MRSHQYTTTRAGPGSFPETTLVQQAARRTFFGIGCVINRQPLGCFKALLHDRVSTVFGVKTRTGSFRLSSFNPFMPISLFSRPVAESDMS